jgi:tetratricopeptide (TPR) repeat protein
VILQLNSAINPSRRAWRRLIVCPAILIALSGALVTDLCAQGTKTTPPSSSSAQQAIKLVESGRCKQALPALKQAMPHLADKQLKYHAAMALARCSMGLGDEQTAVDTLFLLKRQFPSDPEVLYIATHYLSQLGERMSKELEAEAPASFQARKLQAESLESQGKYDEADAIYRKILEENPHTPGIHYRIGQILLAKAGPSGSTAEAKVEFQKETEVDPLNAAAEFVLGELARRNSQWDEAISHFTRASKLDIGFSEAYLALGMSLTSSGKFAESIAPLERYTAMQPNDPAGHYQLALAYSRTGNREASSKQIALQREMAGRQQQTDTVEGHAAPR